MVWRLDDPITIATAAGIGAALQAVAWRVSHPRGSQRWQTLCGAGLVNGLVCSGSSMIALRWLPESPIWIIGAAWILAWLIDFSQADTRARWASFLFEIAELYLRSRKDRKDDPK